MKEHISLVHAKKKSFQCKKEGISLSNNQLITKRLKAPWCSTKVDENGVHKGGQGLWGYCGAGCPREDDDVWVTDDTLTVTHHHDTDSY